MWDKRNSDRSIISREVLENEFSEMEKGKGIKLAEFLAEKEIDILYTKEGFDGKGPEYVLSDAEVEVIKTEFNTIEDLLKEKT